MVSWIPQLLVFGADEQLSLRPGLPGCRCRKNDILWLLDLRQGRRLPTLLPRPIHNRVPGLCGQTTILHFQVVGNHAPFDYATIVSDSSFVGYTSGSAGTGPLKLDAHYRNPRIGNSVVPALTNTGHSTLTGSPYTNEIFFSPNMSQADTWGYYALYGTLGNPAVLSWTMRSRERDLFPSISTDFANLGFLRQLIRRRRSRSTHEHLAFFP